MNLVDYAQQTAFRRRAHHLGDWSIHGGVAFSQAVAVVVAFLVTRLVLTVFGVPLSVGSSLLWAGPTIVAWHAFKRDRIEGRTVAAYCAARVRYVCAARVVTVR